MNNIKSYNRLVSRLNNNNHYSFYHNISRYVEESDLSATKLRASWSAFARIYGKEKKIYKRSARYVETKYIYIARQERFDTYLMIRLRVESATHSYEAAEREWAGILKEAIPDYSTAARAPMNEVTPIISRMVKKLREPRYEPCVAMLGLTDAVNRLEEINATFANIYNERSLSLETSKIEGTMRSIRPKVDKAFRSFADGVEALYVDGRLSGVSDSDNIFAGIIVNINAEIDQQKLTYSRSRRTS
ncbi:MAG: DUF6261 family protein [Tannerellaceae bacterium]|jgi:hypothetical protein|nr:DUF6261 family protein [Tannerellaceae bacterium]